MTAPEKSLVIAGCGAYAVVLLLGIGLIFSPLLTTTTYLAGAVFQFIGTMSFSRLRWTSSLDKALFDFSRAYSATKIGRVFFTIYYFTYIIICNLNWPLDYIRSAYLFAINRSKIPHMRALLLANSLLPIWVHPSLVTLAALAWLDQTSLDYPLRLLAYCFVLSTFLILLSSVFLVNLKEEILRRPGPPRLGFLILIAFNFANIGFARKIISRLEESTDETFSQSLYQAFSLADVRTIASDYHLSIADLAQNIGSIANLSDVPAGLMANAILAILFYFGFVRIFLEMMSIQREPKHYVERGAALAVIGQLDAAAECLAKSSDDQAAVLLLAGVQMRRGRFRDSTKAATRFCALADIPHSAEEEAANVVMNATGLGLASTAQLLAYFDEMHPRFDEAEFEALLIILHGSLLQDAASLGDVLSGWAGLARSPLLQLSNRAVWKDAAQARSALLGKEPDSVSARLIRSHLCCMTMIENPDATEPDTDLLDVLRKDAIMLTSDRSVLDIHWRLNVADSVTRLNRRLLWKRFGIDDPTLRDVGECLEAALCESSPYQENLGITRGMGMLRIDYNVDGRGII